MEFPQLPLDEIHMDPVPTHISVHLILATIQLDISILVSKWYICADENFCETSLFVCVAAGKNDRIAVQILEHVTKMERRAELFE